MIKTPKVVTIIPNLSTLPLISPILLSKLSLSFLFSSFFSFVSSISFFSSFISALSSSILFCCCSILYSFNVCFSSTLTSALIAMKKPNKISKIKCFMKTSNLKNNLIPYSNTIILTKNILSIFLTNLFLSYF